MPSVFFATCAVLFILAVAVHRTKSMGNPRKMGTSTSTDRPSEYFLCKKKLNCKTFLTVRPMEETVEATAEIVEAGAVRVTVEEVAIVEGVKVKREDDRKKGKDRVRAINDRNRANINRDRLDPETDEADRAIIKRIVAIVEVVAKNVEDRHVDEHLLRHPLNYRFLKKPDRQSVSVTIEAHRLLKISVRKKGTLVPYLSCNYRNVYAPEIWKSSSARSVK